MEDLCYYWEYDQWRFQLASLDSLVRIGYLPTVGNSRQQQATVGNSRQPYTKAVIGISKIVTKWFVVCPSSSSWASRAQMRNYLLVSQIMNTALPSDAKIS